MERQVMLLAFLFCFAVLTSEAQMAPPKSDAIYRNFHGPGQDFFVFGYNPNDHAVANVVSTYIFH